MCHGNDDNQGGRWPVLWSIVQHVVDLLTTACPSRLKACRLPMALRRCPLEPLAGTSELTVLACGHDGNDE
jgi:hypothetical protein